MKSNTLDKKEIEKFSKIAEEEQRNKDLKEKRKKEKFLKEKGAFSCIPGELLIV